MCIYRKFDGLLCGRSQSGDYVVYVYQISRYYMLYIFTYIHKKWRGENINQKMFFSQFSSLAFSTAVVVDKISNETINVTFFN